MAITGQETALASALTASIVASIEATFKNTIYPSEQQGIQALATGIANGLIPFLVTNTQLNIGQSVNVPGTGLTVLVDTMEVPVTGDATGTVTTTGTIS